jgi:hypothetical protein
MRPSHPLLSRQKEQSQFTTQTTRTSTIPVILTYTYVILIFVGFIYKVVYSCNKLDVLFDVEEDPMFSVQKL